MRKVAAVNHPQTKRVMLYNADDGCYLFLYNQLEDGACYADYFFEELEDMYQHCSDEYGIGTDAWQTIPDPEEGCFHDRIAAITF